MNTNAKIIMGFLTGTMIGTITGLMIAPSTGKKTRKNIGKKSKKLARQIAGYIGASPRHRASTYTRNGKSSVEAQ